MHLLWAEVPKQYQIYRIYRIYGTIQYNEALLFNLFTSLAHQNLPPRESVEYLNGASTPRQLMQLEIRCASLQFGRAREHLDKVGCRGLCSSTKEALRSTRPCKTSTWKRNAKVEISFTSIYNCLHCICYEASFADTCGCPAGTTMKSLDYHHHQHTHHGVRRWK